MIKSYCIKCKKERVIIVDGTAISKREIKYEGKCSLCGEYCCRIYKK